MSASPPARLHLPQVTLCAVTSVNVAATVRALQASLDQVSFARCMLLTDGSAPLDDPRIEVVRIARLTSSAAYSDFLLTRLVDHVATSHCLVSQWDGHVLDAARWLPAFLDYDYIGASWPQFDDWHGVGNGGFSLRSRALMALCRAPGFAPLHPEDIAIGRLNRNWLEGQGMRFAPRAIADLFAAERSGNLARAFGYHGVFNMPSAIGVEAFWRIYGELDERSGVRHDFLSIARQMARGPGGARRGLRMAADWLARAPRR